MYKSVGYQQEFETDDIFIISFNNCDLFVLKMHACHFVMTGNHIKFA